MGFFADIETEFAYFASNSVKTPPHKLIKPNMKFHELQYLWKAVKAAALFSGVMLSFFAVVEFLRAYTILAEFHRYAGYAFLAISAGIGIGTILYIIRTIAARPRAIRPPEIRDQSSATLGELRAYGDYLMKFGKRLMQNRSVPDDSIPQLQKGLYDFGTVYVHSVSEHELLGTIRRFESENIEPVLACLDESAEREIQGCVRDIMIGVTLSPYRAMDLFVVLYRNAIMITNIIKIYNTRPALLEQVAIVKDVLGVVATVNFINFGSRFTEQLMSNVPYIGTIIDDIAQGIGAGLLTSAAGHAAMHRARAYRGWDRKESMEMMASKIDIFFRDIYSIFRHDVLPKMRYRVASAETWEKLTSGVSFVFEKMAGIIRSFVRVPAVQNGSFRSVELENGNGGYSLFKSAITIPYSVVKWGVGKITISAGSLLQRKSREETDERDT